MRPLLVLILCASLAANILLLKNRRASLSPTAAQAAKASSPETVPALSADTWALIKSGDPAGPEKLRALGLSDYLIRMLVRQELDHRYEAREKALLSAVSPEYWKYDYSYARWKNVDRLKMLDLQREKEAELKALVGSERDPEPSYDTRFSFLPPAKADQLRRLEEDYQALSQGASSFDGVVLPEDRERLDYLEKQKRADLAELLTSDELAAYDLRSSQSSRALSYQLSAFDASEEEFKALYAVRKTYDDQHPTPPNVFYSTPPGTQKEREAFDAQIKDALGAERFATYQRSQDQDYKVLAKLATRLDLPPEKSIEAYNLKATLEEKLKTFRPTPGGDFRQQRAELLVNLQKEAQTGFTQILGEKGYAAYKDYGQIFRRLNPPPPPVAPKS